MSTIVTPLKIVAKVKGTRDFPSAIFVHYEEGATLVEATVSDGFDLEIARRGDVEYLTNRLLSELAFLEGDVSDGENGLVGRHNCCYNFVNR